MAENTHPLPSAAADAAAAPVTALALATWLEARLHETLPDAAPDPFRIDARLFGLTVVDPGQVGRGAPDAVRVSQLGEANSVYDLIEGPAGGIARLFDAAAVMTSGWAAPVTAEEAEASGERPSRHPERRRVRLVVVVDDRGVGSVLRFADDPDRVLAEPGGSGLLADALDDLWTLGPTVPADAAGDRGTLPARSSACARR